VNLVLAVDAIYSVIDANKASVVSGIVHQGQQREIKEIHKSVLTPPLEYYAVMIHVGEGPEALQDARNSPIRVPVSEYHAEVHISDFAIPQQGDPDQTPYETMHTDFRTVVSKLAKVFRDTQWMPNATTRPRYTLKDPGKEIRVSDRTRWFADAANRYPVLYAVISFTLQTSCDDGASL
jgi:hypothetical protein